MLSQMFKEYEPESTMTEKDYDYYDDCYDEEE